MIINATSLGLNNEALNLNFSEVGDNKLFYDVIYNPSETIFLKEGKIRRGARKIKRKRTKYAEKNAGDYLVRRRRFFCLEQAPKAVPATPRGDPLGVPGRPGRSPGSPRGGGRPPPPWGSQF